MARKKPIYYSAPDKMCYIYAYKNHVRPKSLLLMYPACLLIVMGFGAVDGSFSQYEMSILLGDVHGP